MQDVLGARPPTIGVQRAEDTEQQISRQVWALAACQRVDPDRLRIGRIHDHCLPHQVGWEARRDIGDQIALRIDHHHTAARHRILQRQVGQQRGLTDARRPQHMQVTQRRLRRQRY